MPAPTTAADRARPVPAEFRRVALSALLAGLCPLIPFPFVDEWALTQVRRRAVRDLLRRSGLAPSPGQVRILAGEEVRGRGCLLGALGWAALKVAFYLVRKLYRTLIFVLTLGDSTRRVAELYGEAYLLVHAARTGLAARALAAGDDGARWLRFMITAAVSEVDRRPVVRTVRAALAGSWGLLRRGARRLVRSLRRHRGAPAADAVPVAEEAGLLAGVLDRLTAALWLQEEYRRQLVERFEAHWRASAGEPRTAALYYDRTPAPPRDDRDPGRAEA